MFNCALCKQTIGPRISPVMAVTGTREAFYTNHVKVIDEYERETIKVVNSEGREITSQIAACPPCVGEELPIPQPTMLKRVIHEEKLPEPMRSTLAYLTAQNALDRNLHDSKRAKADFAAAVPLIKGFADRNKEFAF